MKKYITIAALLAAGTAFANAEVVATTTLKGTTAISDIDGITAAVGGVYSVNNDNGTITTTPVTQKTNNNISNYIFAPDTNVQTAAGWSTSITFSYDDWGKVFATLDSVSVNLVSFNGSGNTQNADRSAMYKLSLTDAKGESLGTSVEEWTEFKVNGTGETSTPYTDILLSTIPTASLTSSFTGDISTYTGDLVLTVSVKKGSQGDGSFFGIKNITFAGSPIPEPSAFGLLAGLGALALVASRRRRK